MADPISFDPYLGWVNITDPNNVPVEARVLRAEDLIRYEKFGKDAAAKLNSIATELTGRLTIAEGDARYATEASVNSELAGRIEPAVAKAIASDNTVVLAAEAAVDEAMIDKDVLEGGVIMEDGIAFSIVDEDGRRTWIEVGADGKPTDYAAGMISDKVAPGITADVEATIGVEDMSTPITELAFVVVDEDGRRTEVEIGTDGRFTQRVIDSINSRLTYPAPPADTSVQVIAPSSFPMVIGKTYRLYFSDIVTALDPSYTVNVSGLLGNYGTYWQYTPTTAGNFTLTIRVYSRTGTLITSKAIPVTIYAAVSGAGKRHLAIGDSITRAGNYSGLALSTLVGAKTVGTRTYNDGALATEGRGGWSLATYFTNIGHATAGDSPFLFPTTVAGNKFWGNTEFWRKVSYVAMNTLPTSGYDFDGFQKMARNWGPMTSDPVFDANGYPKAPAAGDVVVNPTKAAGSQWEQYTGGVWTTIATPALEFSFSKYMQRYAAAYPEGGPTSISIMLETNDFFGSLDDAVFATWKTRMDTVIASVRAWSTTVPFIICIAPTGGPNDKWATQTVTKFDFDRRIKDAAQRILAAYDTQANRDNKVYVSSFLGEVSPANMSDHVHPVVTAGHEDMSAALAGTLTKLITEGA